MIDPVRFPMNEDRVKGTIDELAGSAKRKVGEATGSTRLQVEGAVQQVKGKLENAWGRAKDAVHEANVEADVQHESRLDEAMNESAVETEPGVRGL